VLGLLRVLPVRGDLAFLQPAYDRSRDVSPALAAVVVATADTTRVGRTLTSAVGAAPGVPAAAEGDRLARARSLYDAMRQALQRADWPTFGRALDSLGAAVGPRPRRGRAACPSDRPPGSLPGCRPGHRTRALRAAPHPSETSVNIHEYQAKDVLRRYGVPIPPARSRRRRTRPRRSPAASASPSW
jgi:hypothetical protein